MENRQAPCPRCGGTSRLEGTLRWEHGSTIYFTTAKGLLDWRQLLFDLTAIVCEQCGHVELQAAVKK